jgi:hypothetical protein
VNNVDDEAKLKVEKQKADKEKKREENKLADEDKRKPGAEKLEKLRVCLVAILR